MGLAIVWFRQDLRVSDHPALARAAERGHAVVPVYIWSKGEAGMWAAGGASRWWLHHALVDLAGQLGKAGLRLVVRKGRSEEVLPALVEESGAEAVYWNRCYEPWRTRIDSRLKERLRASGVEAWSGNASLLREPWEVATQAGKPYKVFSPYARNCAGRPDPGPVGNGKAMAGPEEWPAGMKVEELGLLPKVDWDTGLAAAWKPSRAGAEERMQSFLSRVSRYKEARDLPAEDGTSGLSPYLHWGQVGPREVAAWLREDGGQSGGRKTFYNELIWREFAYHVLYHFPDTPEEPLQRKFAGFPWEEDAELLRAWQAGQTGYPLVDAGMRQLWESGWMHNRVRMLVGSVLVKHFLQPWQAGARWFWDCLVDADLASNTLGWQWAGGCGADAAPYFRIFNPITQSEKFDPAGTYIRRYVPELREVPGKWIHRPWEMPEALQERSGCRIGDDYPEPVVGHQAGRQRALAAFAQVKEAG